MDGYSAIKINEILICGIEWMHVMLSDRSPPTHVLYNSHQMSRRDTSTVFSKSQWTENQEWLLMFWSFFWKWRKYFRIK